MNIVNSGGRRRRRLALALAFIVSGCAHIALLVDATAAVQAQKKSTSPAKQREAQVDDRSLTRPRRVESQTDSARRASADGPIIRVALMTDVTSVSLSSSSTLIVQRATGFEEGKKISSGSLRVELRQQPDQAASARPGVIAYRVSLGSSHELRSARKLADELKAKFFEPVTTSFDEKQREYAVLIGQFNTHNEAARFADRLRKAGYESPSIVTDSKTSDTSAAATDTNARAAKYKAQPSYAAGDRSSAAAAHRPMELVALAANKITVSSQGRLIIARTERATSKQLGASSVDDEKEQIKRRDQTEDSASTGIASIPSIRIGNRDYRGEIHLVLSSHERINVVNALPLEEYLRGVVPMELPPGAYPEIEALKAQAIAARSYALAHLGQHRDEGFDLVDDARAQVYGGISAERELTNRAIDETRGIVAVYPNEDGKLVPIEALYTANCGGRTENNEEVFGGKPLPYLRSVSCAPDRATLAGREIVTNRMPEPLTGTDGRSITREVALLSVLGFSLPRRMTSHDLRSSPDQDEARSWTGQLARLAGREKPSFARGDVTRLAEFARVVASSIYGEGRANTLLAPADVDYLLGGLRVEQLQREDRADVAMLLRDGILRLPAQSALDGGATITRGQAIETLARAILLKLNGNDRSQTSNLKAQIPDLKCEVSAPAENGRLVIMSSSSTDNATARGQTSRVKSANTSAPAQIARPQQNERRQSESQSVTTKVSEQDGSRRHSQPDGTEIAQNAWLFRSAAGESYAVDRLTLIGGERVTYHLNAGGQVDFLEASLSERGASSDRFSSVAQWQERVPVEELQQRLARSRINVGRPENIEPVTFSSSNRVTEVEITGNEGHTRLRRPQLRTALGLKEYLFVVDREKDARGRVVAFVFSGRGWGHGVGMCQTGAYGLAKEGYSYTAILQKYYTGVKVQKMY